MKNKNTFKGTIYTLIAAICFGATAPIAKFIYGYGITPNFMLALRFFMAAVILWTYLFTFGKRTNAKISLKQFKELFLIGGVIYFFTTFFYFNAIKFIPLSLHVIIFYTYPLMVNIFSFLFLNERYSRNQIFSLLISFLGIIMIVNIPDKNIRIIGLLLSLGAAISNSIYVLMIGRKIISALNSIVIAAYTNLFSGFSFFAYSFLKGEVNFDLDYRVWVGITVIGIFSTAISIIALSEGIKLIGPSKASIICTFEPVEGVILSMIFFGEKLSLIQSLGVIFVITGIIMINIKKGEIRLM